jgi:hypothetical protein
VKSNGSVYVALVFALLAGYFTYQWWFNQNRVVKRRLGELASTLTAPAGEADLDRLARLARLRQFLDDDVQVTAGRSAAPVSSRDAVMAAAAAWKPEGGGTVDFVDVDVKVDEANARAYLTAEVTTRDPKTDEPILDSRDAALSLVKRDGAWVVSAVEVREPTPPSRP